MNTDAKPKNIKKMLSNKQKELLRMLLSKYEGSRTCFGENKIQQTFRAKPDMVYFDYYSDYLDLDTKHRYDSEMGELEKYGYITLKRNKGDIIEIAMVNNAYPEYCDILGKANKLDALASQKSVFIKYADRNELLGKICTEQMERLENNKDNSITTDIKELEKILDCIEYICNNKDEILERELSIAVFSDTKLFEKHYKSKVCSLLLKHEPVAEAFGDMDKKILAEMMLAEHGIVKNPSYIYLKGKGIIVYKDYPYSERRTEKAFTGSPYRIELRPDIPVAINSHTLGQIQHIAIHDKCVMTVENLTSYNRICPNDIFVIYLSGYSNTAKIELLKKIHTFSEDKAWYHFGDIDPDGFHILESLRRKTGIDFKPYCMGIDELSAFRKYTKKLETNDIQKAKTLEQSPYADTIKYMIEHNCKLEQEIISWNEPNITAENK